MQNEPERNDDEQCGDGSEAGGKQHSGVARSDGDDNEDDFGTFEHSDVEGGGEGKTDARGFDRHQYAAHGFAWLATYGAALRELLAWAKRLEQANSLGETEALILQKAGELCARYYQRTDGTILLADCTVGVAQKRKRRVIAAGAAMLLAGGGAAAWWAKHSQPRATMGSVGFDDSENVRMTLQAEALEVAPPPPAPEPQVLPSEEIHATMGAVSITPESQFQLEKEDHK